MMSVSTSFIYVDSIQFKCFLCNSYNFAWGIWRLDHAIRILTIEKGGIIDLLNIGTDGCTIDVAHSW